jgi:hypothetical protein
LFEGDGSGGEVHEDGADGAVVAVHAAGQGGVGPGVFDFGGDADVFAVGPPEDAVGEEGEGGGAFGRAVRGSIPGDSIGIMASSRIGALADQRRTGLGIKEVELGLAAPTSGVIESHLGRTTTETTAWPLIQSFHAYCVLAGATETRQQETFSPAHLPEG